MTDAWFYSMMMMRVPGLLRLTILTALCPIALQWARSGRSWLAAALLCGSAMMLVSPLIAAMFTV